MDAHIPEDYIQDLTQRIDMYQRIAAIQTEEDALDVTDELIDRFGDPPAAVEGLVQVALIRGMASQLGITEIRQQKQRILLYPETLDLAVAGQVAGGMQGRILVNAGTKPYFSVRLEKREAPVKALRGALLLMEEAKSKN